MGATIDTPRHSNNDNHTARPETAEPEGALRAELTARLAVAHADLERQVIEFSRAAGGAGGEGRASEQLAMLASLQRHIIAATPAALAALQTSVRTQVAITQSITASLRADTPSREAIRTAQFAAINADTRGTVESLSADLYEQRIFDPYLKFDSPEDEAGYRQREADTRRYAAEQLAKNTPEGTLNAGGALAGQMLDAEAHGAGESPDFAPRWNELREQLREQRLMVEAEGLSTEEYDRNLQASVRRFLKAKGVPEAEIEAKLKAATDPLDAAQPYLATAKDTETLTAELTADAPPTTASAVKASDTRVSPSVESPNLGAIAASLSSSGVTLADAGSGHGLATAMVAPSAESRTR